ncbi:hypothetical protein [Alloscardovia macacae]|uniref:Uncharacterized protein n=1 Tax=Alloscardovia macacae TaxID=1160091 RepID=A0A261F596_9BIFI|nr:hypothetical protein [Alloscardovia macacae]OZG54213.1 hypothetical protein ALMA_0674 [Alloscardovia macacae]
MTTMFLLAANTTLTDTLTESSCLLITFSMAGLFAVLSFGALLFAARIAGQKNRASECEAENSTGPMEG